MLPRHLPLLAIADCGIEHLRCAALIMGADTM